VVTQDMAPDPAGDLPRRYGFWTGLFVVVASMVGGGILTTSGFILRETENHGVLLALWGLGGLVATCGALTLAELASAMPRVGGEYVYVRRTFGPGWSFVYGAATIVLGFAAPIAVIAHACVAYLVAPLASLGPAHALSAAGGHPWIVPACASVLIVALSAMHVLGQHQSAWVQGVTTLFKLLTLGGIAVAGLLWGDGDFAHLSGGRPFAAQDAGVLAVALIQVSYAYSGWNGAAYLAGEVKKPALLPLCIVGGCLLVTALYALMNLTYAYAIGPRELAGLPAGEVERVAELATTRLFGRGIGNAFSLVVGLGMLASVSAFILTGPRVAFAMARDGLLPASFGRLHAWRATPAMATVVQAILALVVLWSGSFDAMIIYSGAGMAMLAGLVMLCVFPLRRRGVLPGPFAMPLFPLPPVLYLLALGWMVVYAVGADPWPTLLSIASILLMWPIHGLATMLARRKRR
jgi:APA family basic amino acid/polyamine antiporter